MMYVVLLELNGRAADQYAELDRVLKSLGNYSNRIRGGWLVESRLSAAKIRDAIKPHLVAGADKLLVARMSGAWSGTNMGDGFQEWMNRRNFGTPK